MKVSNSFKSKYFFIQLSKLGISYDNVLRNECSLLWANNADGNAYINPKNPNLTEHDYRCRRCERATSVESGQGYTSLYQYYLPGSCSLGSCRHRVWSSFLHKLCTMITLCGNTKQNYWKDLTHPGPFM